LDLISFQASVCISFLHVELEEAKLQPSIDSVGEIIHRSSVNMKYFKNAGMDQHVVDADGHALGRTAGSSPSP